MTRTGAESRRLSRVSSVRANLLDKDLPDMGRATGAIAVGDVAALAGFAWAGAAGPTKSGRASTLTIGAANRRDIARPAMLCPPRGCSPPYATSVYLTS